MFIIGEKQSPLGETLLTQNTERQKKPLPFQNEGKADVGGIAVSLS